MEDGGPRAEGGKVGRVTPLRTVLVAVFTIVHSP
ncbi:hypothetical protein Cflav_PD2514 [Pedosphaera parvula Ellin514]|uniref:Uncharacterized protein n=1 Tax=Pedosphaera parvula (strain Ellin514) TaxID=320771 RepID=B9XKN0_PEDPL|nr:hypothetical protein Cflav_PD2514 [Pedosphaera parvula Ellin514]